MYQWYSNTLIFDKLEEPLGNFLTIVEPIETQINQIQLGMLSVSQLGKSQQKWLKLPTQDTCVLMEFLTCSRSSSVYWTPDRTALLERITSFHACNCLLFYILCSLLVPCCCLLFCLPVSPGSGGLCSHSESGLAFFFIDVHHLSLIWYRNYRNCRVDNRVVTLYFWSQDTVCY